MFIKHSEKKEKVPRLKIIDGRNTKIYQKNMVGSKGNKHFNEYDEIINKYNFIYIFNKKLNLNI